MTNSLMKSLDLPEVDLSQLSFEEAFESVFAPKLMHREEGFRTIFSKITSPCPIVVETGCLRSLGNWGGDGQSTFLFDTFVSKNTGLLYSIDINIESISIAKQVCTSPTTTLICGDGTVKINSLSKDMNILSGIDLLYLDSFDAFRDISQIPAPVHYMLELAAAWPALRPGSLVAIDDFHNQEAPGVPASKGLAVDMFLTSVGAEVIHDEHQKIWIIR